MSFVCCSRLLVSSTALAKNVGTRFGTPQALVGRNSKVPVQFGNRQQTFNLSCRKEVSSYRSSRLMCTAEGEASTPVEEKTEVKKEKEVEEGIQDRLDIRVGKILKAWVHPDADGLFVEEVDVGEEEPRTICSGLVGYIPEDELQDRDVIVLCNLKPRNMRGIKSNGMLMAAADADHKVVELLTPPAGVVPGERVRFGTLEGEQADPDSPNRVQKKKVFEAVQPDLNTSDECVVRYKDMEMLTTEGKVVVKSLTGAEVS